MSTSYFSDPSSNKECSKQIEIYLTTSGGVYKYFEMDDKKINDIICYNSSFNIVHDKIF